MILKSMMNFIIKMTSPHLNATRFKVIDKKISINQDAILYWFQYNNYSTKVKFDTANQPYLQLLQTIISLKIVICYKGK